mmetsp:Transcript_11627/g.21503  ORF Transcript_11627/g.21503 Transcript_11627/m.21503 type:complete len:275 (-) Transcript_11627:1691-2515(-)
MTRPHIIIEYQLERIIRRPSSPLFTERDLLFFRIPFQIPHGIVQHFIIISRFSPIVGIIFSLLLGKYRACNFFRILLRPSRQHLFQSVLDPIFSPHLFVAMQNLDELSTSHDLLERRPTIGDRGAIDGQYDAADAKSIHGMGVGEESLRVNVGDADESFRDGAATYAVDARGDESYPVMAWSGWPPSSFSALCSCGSCSFGCYNSCTSCIRCTGFTSIAIFSLSATSSSASRGIGVDSTRLGPPAPPLHLTIHKPPRSFHGTNPQTQIPFGLRN